MPYELEKTDNEIEALLDRIGKSEGNLGGMTYQEGLRDAIDWLTGNWDEVDGDLLGDYA